jgi:hypothetical protein
MKATQKLDTELIDQTIAVWQPRSRGKLCPEDARQIAENIVGFIGILKEWNTEESHKGIREVRHAG